MRSEHTHTKQDAELESAQNAYLARHAPGFQTRRIRWSGGATQMIEVGPGPPLLLLDTMVGWKRTVRNLLMAWVLTLPIAILLSGSLYWLFSQLF